MCQAPSLYCEYTHYLNAVRYEYTYRASGDKADVATSRPALQVPLYHPTTAGHGAPSAQLGFADAFGPKEECREKEKEERRAQKAYVPLLGPQRITTSGLRFRRWDGQYLSSNPARTRMPVRRPGTSYCAQGRITSYVLGPGDLGEGPPPTSRRIG